MPIGSLLPVVRRQGLASERDPRSHQGLEICHPPVKRHVRIRLVHCLCTTGSSDPIGILPATDILLVYHSSDNPPVSRARYGRVARKSSQIDLQGLWRRVDIAVSAHRGSSE
jgi:hypothetical protein